MRKILLILFKPFLIEYAKWVHVYRLIYFLKTINAQKKAIIINIIEIDTEIYLGRNQYIQIRDRYLEVLEDLEKEKKQINLSIIKLIFV